ncbi:MAG: porin family protein [Verrucomicrobia bacterium]|nr:porin family protein [Verrucomicrobiota bacterium]
MFGKIKIRTLFFAVASGVAGGALLAFLILKNEEFEKSTVPDSEKYSLRNLLYPNENDGENFSESETASRFAHRDFSFNGENVVIKNASDGNAESRLEFSKGDLYERYGGGRDNHPSNTPNAKDNRVWVDAKIPIEISSRLKLYSVSTMTLGTTESNSLETYTQNYSLGGGFGLSYRVSDNVEFDFDYRRTRPIDSKNEDPATSAAGISVKLSF